MAMCFWSGSVRSSLQSICGVHQVCWACQVCQVHQVHWGCLVCLVHLVCWAKFPSLRISAAEVEAYDKWVVVLWQENAWVDSQVLSKITQTLSKDHAERYGLEEEMLWLGDNLHCHSTLEYCTEMRNCCNGLVKNYLPNIPDKGMAPVNNGLGFMVKHNIGMKQEKWLENEDNIKVLG